MGRSRSRDRGHRERRRSRSRSREHRHHRSSRDGRDYERRRRDRDDEERRRRDRDRRSRSRERHSRRRSRSREMSRRSRSPKEASVLEYRPIERNPVEPAPEQPQEPIKTGPTEEEIEEEKRRQRKERIALWKQQKQKMQSETNESGKKEAEPIVKNEPTQVFSAPAPVAPAKQPAMTSNRFSGFKLKKQTKIIGGFAEEDEEEENVMVQKSKIRKINFDEEVEPVVKEEEPKTRHPEDSTKADLITGMEESDELDQFMDGVVEEVQKLEQEQYEGRLETNEVVMTNPEEFEEYEESAEKITGDFVAPLEEEIEDPNALLLAAAGGRAPAKKKDLAVVDHSKIDYQPFRKAFLIEPEELTELNHAEIELKRAELDNVKIRGLNCPAPVDNWPQMGLLHSCSEVLKRNLKFEKPSPIQAQAIPAIMSGRDVIGIAKTGSGKTLAFLLPMFRHIMDQPPLRKGDGPIALVMTPTRELALQILKDCRNFTRVLGIRAACAYGGAQIKDQIADLKKGAHIVICTPGRMIDLLCVNGGRITNLQRITYLVLDEADRMFDLGFEPQVMRIVENIRPDKQCVLFSATFPRSMEALAKKILVRPLEIVVGGRSVVCPDVTQTVEVRDDETKFIRLLEILGATMEEDPESKVLIFVDKHESADNMLRDLLKRGYPCQSLHGGKDQADRDSTIADFKSGATNVLVATSVAARGLDVSKLRVVVNYDCPNHMEDYVHRVGRTGRAGNKGSAYTFITPEQERFSVDILKALKMSNAPIPPELAKLSNEFIAKVKSGGARYQGSGYGGKGLEKLEADRDAAKKVQQLTRAAELDIEDEVDDIEDEEEKKKKKEGEDEIEKKMQVDKDESTAAPEKSKEASAASKPSEGGGNARPLTAMEKARQIAASLGSTVKQNALLKSATGAVACEIEVNDFPQKARWNITSKETLHAITHVTGAAITVRGTFFPAGRNPKIGERKLYLYIESNSQDAVDRARAEVKKVLYDTTMESIERGDLGPVANQYGRYQVV